MSSRRSIGIPGPLSRTSMRQWPVGSRAKVKLTTGSSNIGRRADCVPQQIEQRLGEKFGIGVQVERVLARLDSRASIFRSAAFASARRKISSPHGFALNGAGALRASARTRDSSRRSGGYLRPGGRRSRSPSAPRQCAVAFRCGRNDISAPERASEVTGVSEFMISWVSTRTRSACAATSSAPSSLCTGRIDSTVTGLSSRATCAEAKIAFCGTPSSIEPSDLACARREADRRREFGTKSDRDLEGVKRLPRKELARGLVEHLDPAFAIDASKAHLAHRRRSPRDSGFHRSPRYDVPEGSSGHDRALPENIETATAGVGKALGIVLEAHDFR